MAFRRKGAYELKVDNCCKIIINCLKKLNEDEHDHALLMIEEVLIDFIEGLDKFDIMKSKRNRNMLKAMQNDPHEYVSENRLYNLNLNLFFKFLNNDGFENLFYHLQECHERLENKSYLKKCVKNDEDIDLSEYYKILGFPSDLCHVPSKEEIKRAYRKQSLLLHPDKHPHESLKYKELFLKLNKANKYFMER